MLTVLLATRNGSTTLPRMLEALSSLEAPDDGWRLVVVDNGSTDGTLKLLESWAEELPLAIVSEPRPGKNIALNAGLRFVVGDMVVLTDDDVVPKSDWLLCLRSVMESNPEYDVVGGRIEPLWEAAPPDSLRHLGPLFSITDPELEEGPAHPQLIWGPNMAVRMRVFDAGYRFDETIGPSPSPNYTMGSETEFTSRLYRDGYRCWFSRAPCVGHMIPKEHLAHRWMFGRARRLGRAQARLGQRRAHVPKILGVPRWIFRRIVELPALYIWATVCRDPQGQFEARWETNILIGRLAQHFESKF